MSFVADVLGVGKGPEKAAQRAGDAQVQAAQIGADTIREQQKQYKEDSAPYAQAGQQGLASLLYGLTGQQMGGAPQPAAVAPVPAATYAPTSPSPEQQQLASAMLNSIRGIAGKDWKGALKNSAQMANPVQPKPAGAEISPPMNFNGGDMGIGAGDLMRSYSFQDFRENPDYQFRLNRGMEGVESSAAARGGLMSGAALKSLNEFNRGTFDQQFANERQNFQGEQANRYSRLFDLARMGQNTVAQTGTAGASAAAGVADLQNQAGQSRAGAILGKENARQDRYAGYADIAGRLFGMV